MKLDIIRKIDKSADRLSRLAEKTLLACRLKTSGRISRQKLDIGQTICDVRDELEKFAAELDVRVVLDIKNVSVFGNAGLIAKAFYYVLQNAVRFSPRGAMVTVTTARKDTSVEIAIQDQGNGIETDRLDAIFDFFSIKDSIHHTAGLGLSLALARQIALLHGGSLEVESEPQKGATFLFRLPVN